MSTICPNCLRPVRADAKFCGFCGNNLNPTAHDDGPVALSVALESGNVKVNSTAQPQAKPSGGKTRRRLLMVIIVLLCLVLLIAFSAYYLQLVR
jgi:hypothetical protein